MSGLLQIFKSNKNKEFLYRDEHKWFHEHKAVSEAFTRLHSITEDYPKVSKLLENLLFIQSNGQYACTVRADINIIIIFPELTFLMKNNKREQAVSILLHEIGHIILEHQKNGTPNDQAQIEADLFAVELGQGQHIYHFLSNQTQTNQIKKRLSALARVLNL